MYCSDSTIGDKGVPIARWGHLEYAQCGHLYGADKFDIIHNHACFQALAMAGLVNTPVFTTLCLGLESEGITLFAAYKGWYNTVSRWE